MKRIVLLLGIFLASRGALADALPSKTINIGSLTVSYTTLDPTGHPVGDILYLHGYGDRFKNHMPLFQSWVQSGFSVIAFDYPSHGLTTGGDRDDLNRHSFASLARLASEVLSKNSSGGQPRPLIVAGWSTGGLLAIRIAQEPELRRLFPSLKGLILYAPAVSTWKCPGNQFCQITNETLTHNRSLYDRDISPAYPLARLGFGLDLMKNGIQSWRRPMPIDVPSLVFIAGDTADRYVKSKRLKNWVQHQRVKFSAPIEAVQCPSSRHELDNEPAEYGGSFVRDRSVNFASSIVGNRKPERHPTQSPCFEF